MDKRSTSIIAGVVVIAVAFALFVFVRSMFSVDREPAPEPPAESVTENRPQITLTAKHAFRDGVHTVVGEYDLPTPCHILETASSVSKDGKSAVIDFTVSTKTDDPCVQVITPTRYRVQLTAAPDAEITARLNGEPAVLNLIEAGPNEDLENVELYIKG